MRILDDPLWRISLCSALRTSLATVIIGCATLYGPSDLLQLAPFPAWSYVSTIILVTDGTLGDALHGCWLALHATVLSIGPAILSLWLIRPGHLTCSTTALAVGLGGLVLVWPEMALVGKKIGLGQIILVYVLAFVNGGETDAVMHPIHLAASTAVGAVACLLALLLPFPRLACREVRQNCKAFGENVSKRLGLFVEALCAQDNSSAATSISQARLLGVTGRKLLQTIKLYQGSMKWERPPFRLMSRPMNYNPAQKLQETETILRAMEMALETITPSFPITILDTNLKQGLLNLEQHITLSTTKQADSMTVPESKAENIVKFLHTLQQIPTSDKDLAPLFFMFCLKTLHTKSLPQNFEKNPSTQTNPSSKKDRFSFSSSIKTMLKNKRVIHSFKTSLSLFLAVLLGSIYSKPNGYWSALPLAISLGGPREPTYKVSNLKAQGTVLGTVYGVLGSSLFERVLPIRFLLLIPWFIFCSFLRRSRMYGNAGGMAAVVGAVLILGRKNFGPPSEFAIARIVEAYIGFACWIMVELVFQPTRACTLARAKLSTSLEMLSNCVGLLSFRCGKDDNFAENLKNLRAEMCEMGKLIEEAEVEPNFWFLPYNGACFNKLFGSLSKMVDLLDFGAQAIGLLCDDKESPVSKEIWNKIDEDLNVFTELLVGLMKCLEEISMVKSITVLENEIEKNNVLACDVEAGKSKNPAIFRVLGSNGDERRRALELDSFLEHSGEVVDGMEQCEVEVKSQMVLSLGALGYCLASLLVESKKIEDGVRELMQWENPSSHINLREIACKLHASHC